MSDTIFALASGAGLSAISVIRISGPHAGSALEALAGRITRPRHATLTELRDPMSGALLDRGLGIWFPAPASFTGEDSVELHVHGGRAVVSGVLSALSACEGLRPAEAGEFARRAFLNGKLDLTEAEGLSDLIEASTAAQRDQALHQTGGRLRLAAEEWRTALLELQARLEAEIDFSDEGDVPAEVTAGMMETLEHLNNQLRAALRDAHRGEVMRDGFSVVIVGPPNAGKSSLLNALAGRDAAIVSEIAGTTRDVIEVFLDLGGLPVVLVDTAGLRQTSDVIEGEGVRRALDRARKADLVLSLAAPEQAHERIETLAPVIPVLTKADLRLSDSDTERGIGVSAMTGGGLDCLLAKIEAVVRDALRPSEPALVSTVRQESALRRCLECLGRVSSGAPLELIAEDVRMATRQLAELIGLVGPEDVLEEIFGRFCIGK